MRKNYFTLLFLLLLILTGCGGTTQSLLSSNNNSGNSATDILGNLIGSVTNRTNENTILGTWVYQEPAVQMESGNIIASAASGLANKQIESKLESYYKTIGITKGSFTITFNSDKSCTYTIKGKESSGTYEFDSSTNKISIKSNGILSLPSSYAKVSGQSLELTFETTSLLNMAQGVASASGNTTLNAISTLSKTYTGMKTGFNFKKK
jgi:hypothetical protein